SILCEAREGRLTAMMGLRVPAVLALVGLLAPGLPAQDKKPTPVVTLPTIPAFKMSPETYFVLRGKVTAPQTDFIRRLRQVPAVESLGEPDVLIIGTHLKRPSKAFETKDAYIESDWIEPKDLAVMAALVPRTALAV